MLATSRLYSFLDHKNGFNIHFLEGQKLIHDLILLHPMNSSGFSYFRDTFLGLLPIIFFLKPQESLGLYIDSEEPLHVAGGFTLDGFGSPFIPSIEGDYTNVVGISMPFLRSAMKQLGYTWPQVKEMP